jgi:clan AA aspartic protease (TIGR02281 family)
LPALIAVTGVAFVASTIAAAAVTDYERIATLPCTSYLASYEHKGNSKLFDPVAEYLQEKGLPGNWPNLVDAVTCECRLHEVETIGSAVARLIAAFQRGVFPSVPIGGATGDPKVHRDWNAFDSWVGHRGARPRLSNGEGQFACDYFALATPKEPRRAEVPMRKEGGIFVVPVEINGKITLDFTIDSGASYVSVPLDVFSTLRRQGAIQNADITGEQTSVLADGSTIQTVTFTIRSLKIGDIVIENVAGGVAPLRGSLLLGLSFLERFKSWSIDNSNHVLVLEPQQALD